jgi:hypothetical protein
MNTMTMPGFTAEDSIYSKGGFDKATVPVSKNTTERVQPAMRFNCFTLGRAYFDALFADNLGLAHFLFGYARGIGCDLGGVGNGM